MSRGFIRISEEVASVIDKNRRAVSESRDYSVLKAERPGVFLCPKFLTDNSAESLIVKKIKPGKSYPTKFTLKPHQKEPVQITVKTLVKNTGALLQAPCGSGKTVMALSVAASLGLTSVIILVDQVNIAVQWQSSIWAVLGLRSEIFCADYKQVTDKAVHADGFRIIVAQSLMRQNFVNNPIACDLLIVDEAHVFSAPAFLSSVFNVAFTYSLALTATPDRKDALEWVFQAVLGREIIEATKPSNNARINIVNIKLSTQIKTSDYTMWWCRPKKKSTWLAACASCDLYDLYPKCGGAALYSSGKPRIMMAGLIKRVVFDPDYVAFTKETLASFHKNKRQALIFSHLKEHLRFLYSFAVEAFGEDACGLYIGGALAEDKKNRQDAMTKPLTFCTYSIANKALDVPHKDTAFFTSPISDIRQAKGRVERDVPGKNRPVIIDPVIADIGMFRGMANKRQKTYKDTNCAITYVNRDYSSNQKSGQHNPDYTKKGS